MSNLSSFDIGYPTVNCDVSGINLCDIECETDYKGSEVTKLSEFVRKHYLHYLRKLLKENYSLWKTTTCNDIEVSEKDIFSCAEFLEIEAVKSSMILELYRKTILNTISNIKCETNLNLLHSKLLSLATRKQYREVAVQTECEQSLEEKIKLFEENILPKKRRIDKDFLEMPMKMPSPVNCEPKDIPKMNSINTNIADIEQKLDDIFGGTDVEDIFEEYNNKPEIQAIINEIENFDETKLMPKNELCKTEVPDNVIKMPSDEELEIMKLKNSIWPSELHIQTMKLRQFLMELADESFEKYEKVKQKFKYIFGDEGDDDDDDYLGPYSPTFEESEILLSSSRTRIVNYIVNLLMPYLNDGVIDNRFTFKKIAKSLSDSIINLDTFADNEYMDRYVQQYFADTLLVSSSVADIN